MHDNENPMRTEATKKLFTVDEYYKIVEAGVFPERVRTELIDGEIIEMTGMGVAHAMAITRAEQLTVVDPTAKRDPLAGVQLAVTGGAPPAIAGSGKLMATGCPSSDCDVCAAGH